MKPSIILQNMSDVALLPKEQFIRTRNVVFNDFIIYSINILYSSLNIKVMHRYVHSSYTIYIIIIQF